MGRTTLLRLPVGHHYRNRINPEQVRITKNPAKINGQYPDRATLIVAKYTVLEGNFHDIIEKIGSGGMFIQSNRSIEMGQPLLLIHHLLNRFGIKDRYAYRNALNPRLIPKQPQIYTAHESLFKR